MTTRTRLIVAAVAGALLAPGLLAAQEWSANDRPATRGPATAPTGLVVGVNVTGAFVTVDGATFEEHDFAGRGQEGGGGMHFTLGYAFTPALGALLHLGGVVLREDAERLMGGMELALRYSFARSSPRVMPYLEMGMGGLALEDAVEGGGSQLAGGSLSIAAGLNVFVTRALALNADFRYNMGMFTDVSLESRTIADDARMGFSSSRVNVGVNWYPMAGRR